LLAGSTDDIQKIRIFTAPLIDGFGHKLALHAVLRQCVRIRRYARQNPYFSYCRLTNPASSALLVSGRGVRRVNEQEKNAYKFESRHFPFFG
jgi:hypothetical protein